MTAPAELLPADRDYIRRRVGPKVDDARIDAVWAETGSKYGTVVELLTELLAKRRSGADTINVPGQVSLGYGRSIASLEAALKTEQTLWDEERAQTDEPSSGQGGVAVSYPIERVGGSWGR